MDHSKDQWAKESPINKQESVTPVPSPSLARKMPQLKIQANMRAMSAQGRSPASPADDLPPASPPFSYQYKQKRAKQKQPLSRRLLTPATLDIMQGRPVRESLTPPTPSPRLTQWEKTKTKYLAAEMDEETRNEELNRYARSALVLGFIIHLTSFLVLSSLFQWPFRASDNELGTLSLVFISVNMIIGVCVAMIGLLFLGLKGVPLWIQNRLESLYTNQYSARNVCPFTGVANADESCDTCHVKISYKATRVEYEDYSSDMEDEEFFSSENRLVECHWCSLRWRFIWMIPFSLAPVVLGIVHWSTLYSVPVLFYLTWFVSGLFAIVLSFFLVKQLHSLSSITSMFKRFFVPNVQEEVYQLIQVSDQSPLPLFGSPILNSPVSVGTPI